MVEEIKCYEIKVVKMIVGTVKVFAKDKKDITDKEIQNSTIYVKKTIIKANKVDIKEVRW